MSPGLHPLFEVPWGPIIGVYFMLVGVATGLTLLAYWVHPEREPGQVSYAWLTTWVAFLLLVAASILLVVDLEQPLRFYLMVASFSNLGSPMSVGAKLIALKLFLLVIYLYLLARRRMAILAGDLVLSGSATHVLFAFVPFILAVVSLALAVYPAILLARTWTSPLARTPASGVLFLSTALLMGTAVALVLACMGKLRDDVAVHERLRHILIFLVVSQISLLGLWLLSVDSNQVLVGIALPQLWYGAGAAMFWLIIMGFGLVLPACLLPTFPRHRAVAIGGALAVLVGASCTRYLIFFLS